MGQGQGWTGLLACLVLVTVLEDRNPVTPGNGPRGPLPVPEAWWPLCPAPRPTGLAREGYSPSYACRAVTALEGRYSSVLLPVP